MSHYSEINSHNNHHGALSRGWSMLDWQSKNKLIYSTKAENLSYLAQNGYQTLPGFLINGEFCRQFLLLLGMSKTNAWQELSEKIKGTDYQLLQAIANELQAKIVNAVVPSHWQENWLTYAEALNCATLILRPCLAFVGQEEILNSQGLISSQICLQANLAEQVKQIWSQLFSASNILYRQQLDINWQQVDLAILVQPIHNAIASGEARIEDDILTVESTWGLGHSLVRGEVLPDIFTFDLASQTINKQTLGIKTKAYCLDKKNHGNLPKEYVLSLVQQNKYSLNIEQLTDLIQIFRKLAPKSAKISAEWTLVKLPNQAQPQFYLTQYQKQLLSHHSIMDLTPSIPAQPILTGYPASSGQVQGKAYVITEGKQPEQIPAESILIAQQLELNWLPFLSQARGLIVEQAAVNSHGVILARELAIPAIVAAQQATKIIQDGTNILLDGDRGKVYDAAELSVTISEQKYSPSSERVICDYPLATKVMVNLSQTKSLAQIAQLNTDGIGLIRAELMLMDLLAVQPLSVWLKEYAAEFSQHLQALITQFATAFYPRPVFYRSSDWVSPNSTDNNPLGKRGTYSYTLDSTLFELELQAIAQVRKLGWNNLQLILPFVRHLGEFNFAKELIQQQGLLQQDSFELWLMAEVPSILFLLSEYVAAGIKGIAIGVNDLTQLLLGINREEADFAHNYSLNNLAVTRAISQLSQAAKQEKISCSICLDNPSKYPNLLPQLVEWGMDIISVEPNQLKSTRQAIASAEKRLILRSISQKK
ncbi:MAG: hypothetical protein D6756_08355 [Cyanobacteria bacterium J083]|nr:MAG: hypothetical protein D6756_08355 [Cyanobacteria bacterium J083]